MKKTFWTIIFCAIAAFMVIIIFLPTIFSTKAGKNYVVKRISQDTTYKIDIDTLLFSWTGPQIIKGLKISDENMDLEAESIISNMSLFSFYKSLISPQKKVYFFTNTQIKNLDMKVHMPDFPPVELYNVNASIDSKRDGSLIAITGQVSDGNQDRFSLTIDLSKDQRIKNITAKDIPTIALDQFFFYKKAHLRGFLTQLLGSYINLNVKTDLKDNKGPLNIDLSSENSKASISAYIENNIITLTESAIVTLNLSNGVKSANTYIRTTEPIVLRVSSTGFTCPIRPFNVQNLKVQNAFLDLGKLYTLNKGAISELVDMTKLTYTNLVSFWFTSVNMQIDNGILYTDRMDFLINETVHLCTWGNINLVNKKIRMNLGITADTLYYSFGVKGLPDDYILAVPIKGTYDNIKVDSSAATAKILALTALQTPGGIGGIIGTIVSKTQKSDDAPPPKRPFPWEGKVRPRQKKADKPNFFNILGQ